MELKTKINANDNSQDLFITRDFDLPVQLLFKAYTVPEFFEQWMGTKVVKMDIRKFGGYAFETSDASGNVVFKANGTIHECIENEKIVRTFEMENAPFGAQMEFLEFIKLGGETSRINIHSVFKSAELRNQLLKLPFAQGLNMAHNKLQQIVSTLK